MIQRKKTLAFAAALLLAACAQYHPMPLTPAAVHHAFAQPAAPELRVLARSIHHPILRPIDLNDRGGLTPDQVAIIAVVANPALRAARDARGLAHAQLLQAGILPNPVLNAAASYPYAGNLLDAVTASQVGVSWDVTELISRNARLSAARANSASVDLDIAWQEWQTAQGARAAAYDLLSLRAQLALARQIQKQADDDATAIRAAVDRHDKTLLDLTTADANSLDAAAAVLSTQHDVETARLALNKAMGLPPQAQVRLNEKVTWADGAAVPPPEKFLAGLENRRLDLMALRLGYQSEEQTLRVAILEQFPKVNIGFNHQRDDTNVHLAGFEVNVDLPLFDRNQAVIATEKATRQKLFDEYVQRVNEARFDIYAADDDLRAAAAQMRDEENALPSLQRNADVYRDYFQRNEVDILSYQSALADLARKQIDVLKLKQQIVDSKIALELAAGQYLPEPPATE